MTTERKADGALVFGGAALVAAALALTRSGKSAPPSSQVSLDDATMRLLEAIAAAAGDTSLTATAILQAVEALKLGGGGGESGLPSWPNQPYIKSFRLAASVADTAYQFPDLDIPDGMELTIKATATNLGIMSIGGSASTVTNMNDSYPLVPSEQVSYRVKNAKEIWYAAITAAGGVAGDTLSCTVEQASK